MSGISKSRKRVLITGAGGMLGSALVQAMPQQYDCVALSGRSSAPVPTSTEWLQINLLNSAELKRTVYRVRPDIIIHAASSVFVDECEKESEKKFIHDLHVGVTADLVETARELRAQMIYISTESVYDGLKAGLYLETDQVCPLNYYALTKYQGEELVGAYQNGLILRTNIFGWRTDGRLSFGEWVIQGLRERQRRTMFTDVTFTPISTTGLARFISHCIDRNTTGLFHAGGADFVSKYEFALRVASHVGLSGDLLIPCSIDQVPLRAPRPKNTGLDSLKLARALSIALPTLDESIGEWLGSRHAYIGLEPKSEAGA